MQTLRNSELDAQKTAWPQHMQRAIQLAASVFSAAPNPRVREKEGQSSLGSSVSKPVLRI